MITAAARRGRPCHSLLSPSFFQRTGIFPFPSSPSPHHFPLITFHFPLCPWQSHKRMAPVPLAHIAERPLTTVGGGERSVRMMCVLEPLLLGRHRAHQASRSLTGVGSGAFVREERVPYAPRTGCRPHHNAFALPLPLPFALCLALALALPCPCPVPLSRI